MLKMTVSASGSSSPSRNSRRRQATVTPPAVSPKTPSVRASSRMPSTISGSVASVIAPPVRRATSSAYGPSAGLPIDSDLAIVDGFTGATVSAPRAKAAATGLQPSAWAPKTRYGVGSTRPRRPNSPKALSILVNSDPEAMGTTTCSGSRQPSCSATS